MSVVTDTSRPSRIRKSLSLLGSFVIFTVFLLVILSYGYYRYGSFENFRAMFEGKSLLVDATTKSFGSIKPSEKGEIEFILSNISKQPIRILGGDTDCGCMLFYDKLPITIEPERRASIHVQVSPVKPGNYDGRAILYTSAAGSRTLELRVVGKIYPSG